MKKFAVLTLLALLTGLSANAGIILLPVNAGFSPLLLESHVVEAKIVGQVAVTTIEMQFYNPHSQQLECKFLFPVPRGGQVSDFNMMMNGKLVKGEVLEKDKARGIYTDIVRRMRDPGLIEMIDQDLFSASVFPVPPRDSLRLSLTVTQMLNRDGNVVAYEWPLQAPTPRDGRTIDAREYSLMLDINSETPIRAIYSPTHDIEEAVENDYRRAILLNNPTAGPQGAFKCFYTLSKENIGMSMLGHRPSGEDGSFLLMISPAMEMKDVEEQPIDFTFVLDTSGSMNGEKIKQAKNALKQCLAGLRPIDRFSIIRFSTEAEPYESGFLPAADQQLERASKWVDQLRASGGTNIHEALLAALRSESPEGRLHTTLFLTDGMPTIGVTDPASIALDLKKNNKRNVRVFVCGVGFDVNAKLCDEMANETRATSSYIVADEELEVKVATLFDKVRLPVLTNLTLDFHGTRASELYPKELPDLFAGSQLAVFGRYDESGPVGVTLSGKVAGKTYEYVYEGKLPEAEEDNDFVETLWGTRKIGYLLENIRMNGETKELRDEVISLAKRYGVVTPYTSYLITEDSEIVPPGVQEVLALDGRGRTLDLLFDADSMNSVVGSAGRVVRSTGSNQGRVAQNRSIITRGGQRGQRGGGRVVYDPTNGTTSAGSLVRTRASGNRTSSLQYSKLSSLQRNTRTLAETKSLSAAEGARGIAVSKATDDYKRKSKLDRTQAAFKTIGKRVFSFQGGVWVEEELKEKMPEVKIKMMSDAYFELLTLRPELKEVLALGGQVVFELNDHQVIVSEEGMEKLDEKTKKALTKKK